jgi:hypothetical protein
MSSRNIPGVSFVYRDEGRFVPFITGDVTDSVLIMGCAVDGPVNVPIRVNSKNVESLFGPAVYDHVYRSPETTSAGDPKAGRYNGNSLVKAFAEVSQGGCTDIILMRIGDATGTVCAHAVPANATYANSAYTAASGAANLNTLLGVTIKSKFPGSVYNGIGMTLTWNVGGGSVTGDATLVINQDLKKKGRALTIDIRKGGVMLTKRQLIERINGNVRNGSLIAIPAANETNLDEDVVLSTTTPGVNTKYYILSGGIDGVRVANQFDTAAKMYSALMGSDEAAAADELTEVSPLAMLESIEADVIYLACLYADENVGSEATPKTVVKQFGKAVYTAACNEYPMIGVVGTSPAVSPDASTVSTIVDNLTSEFTGTASDALVTGNVNKLKMGYFLSADADTGLSTLNYHDEDMNTDIDLGRFVLCVASDVLFSNAKIGAYYETGAGTYAGLISTLPPHRSSTNMPVPGVKQLGFAYTNRQISRVSGGQPYDETLRENGLGGSYVTFRKSSTGQIVVNLDNSCALRTSDYASYQVTYIVNMVASGMKRVVEPFIGMAAHETTKSALENQVKKFLDYMAETRAIAGGDGEGYKFEVSASGVDNLLGRINIDLSLKPALQIKMINVVISVDPNGV